MTRTSTRRTMFLTSVFGILLAELVAAQGPTPNCTVNITEPRGGQEVGQGVTVVGTAKIPPNHHLWVFARRSNFAPAWWPQDEGPIDTKTGEFRVAAAMGTKDDIQWSFDMAAAVFAEPQHQVLKSYRVQALKSGVWSPIMMPQAACPPVLWSVKKTSHN